MIALNEKTALLFDATNKTTRTVLYDGGSLHPVYALLNCDCVDAICIDGEHIIYVDGGGLYKNNGTGFRISHKGKIFRFPGSGLLVGNRNSKSAPIALNFADLGIEVIAYPSVD